MRTDAGAPVLEMLDQGAQGLPGVEDVVEQQDVAAGDVGCKRLVDDQRRRGRRRSPVAAGLHQRDPQGDPDLADQIGQGDQASRQNGDDRQRLVPVVVLDLPAHRRQAFRILDSLISGSTATAGSITSRSIRQDRQYRHFVNPDHIQPVFEMIRHAASSRLHSCCDSLTHRAAAWIPWLSTRAVSAAPARERTIRTDTVSR